MLCSKLTAQFQMMKYNQVIKELIPLKSQETWSVKEIQILQSSSKLELEAMVKNMYQLQEA